VATVPDAAPEQLGSEGEYADEDAADEQQPHVPVLDMRHFMCQHRLEFVVAERL
jgi:hypothetical protein